MKSKKFFAMMITLIMLFTSLAVFPMQVSATAGVPVSSLVSGKSYFIRNYRSGLYMDVTGAGGVGTQVIQWYLNQEPCQQWRLTYYSGGYYSLSPAHLSSTNYLNQYTASTATGNHIKIWDTGGAPDSYSSWYINYQGTDGQGNSLFSIRTQLAYQQAAVIEGGSYAAEAHVIPWPYSGTTNELWYFEEVSSDTVIDSDMDGQNKTNWCWAACGARLARYNHETYSGSLKPYDRNELLVNTYNTTSYIGYINGAKAAYGLQRQAAMEAYSGSDADNTSPQTTLGLLNVVNDLCYDAVNSTGLWSFDYYWDSNEIWAIKNKLATAPVWLCTSKTPSGGHSLLALGYNSGTDQILIFDTVSKNSGWKNASSIFSSSGFTLTWRTETFYLWGTIYI